MPDYSRRCDVLEKLSILFLIVVITSFLSQLQQALDNKAEYKQEREQLRMSVAKLQAQLQSHRKETQENQETISQLQQSLDEMAERGDQGPAGVWQKQIDVMSQKVEKYDKRMQRYRDERNTVRTLNASLQQQIETLQSTVQQLQSSQVYGSYESGQLQKTLSEESAITKKMEEANSVLQKQLQEATDEKGLQAIRDRMERYKQEREQLRMSVAKLQAQLQSHRKETQENQETISQLQQSLGEMAERGDQGPAGVWQKQIDVMSQKVEKYDKRMQRYHKERNTARILNTSLQQQIETLKGGIMTTEVMVKDGLTVTMMIQKPTNTLNLEQSPEVIVKRRDEKYETGVLAYVGVLDGQVKAGVVLDLPSKLTSMIMKSTLKVHNPRVIILLISINDMQGKELSF